jgi:hypothetical protein
LLMTTTTFVAEAETDIMAKAAKAKTPHFIFEYLLTRISTESALRMLVSRLCGTGREAIETASLAKWKL